MTIGAEHGRSPVGHRDRIAIFPTKELGWWAVGLAAAFFPLVFAAGVLPGAAALGLVSGLGGGVVALMAIVRSRERAVSVFAAFVPLVIGVAFLLTELITGNP